MEILRGSAPDYVYEKEWILVKSCDHLYLTYQIKLLTYLAKQNEVKLIISISESCVVSELLMTFTQKYFEYIKLERRVDS